MGPASPPARGKAGALVADSDDAPGGGARRDLRGLLGALALDLVAAVWGTLLAFLILWFLHDRWLPGWALMCGGLGGVVTRWWVRPSYASFPSYVRRPLSFGVVALGTLFTSWATLVREPISYWILRWREAVALPVVAGVLGVGLAGIIYTYRRLESELRERRRLEEDLQVAKRIQQNLLRSRPTDRSWIEMHAVNVASREVGGDYYEILEIGEEHVCLAVGDVSGKGVPAALLMSSLQSAFLAARAVESSLDRVCSHVNRFLFERTTPERYATFFVADVAPGGRIRYVNAGHNPPMLVGAGGCRRLTGGGMPLGLFAEREYALQEIQAEEGEVLVIYTDGVTESTGNTGEEFGEERLLKVVSSHRPGSAPDIASAILEAVASHSGGVATQHDDITLLVARPRRAGP